MCSLYILLDFTVRFLMDWRRRRFHAWLNAPPKEGYSQWRTPEHEREMKELDVVLAHLFATMSIFFPLLVLAFLTLVFWIPVLFVRYPWEGAILLAFSRICCILRENSSLGEVFEMQDEVERLDLIRQIFRANAIGTAVVFGVFFLFIVCIFIAIGASGYYSKYNPNPVEKEKIHG